MTETVWYTIGHNVAGYLPESEPWLVEGFDAAKRAVIDEARHVADSIEPGTPGPFGETYAENLVAMTEDLNLTSAGPWSASIASGGEHGLPVEWWIVTAEPDAVAEWLADPENA